MLRIVGELLHPIARTFTRGFKLEAVRLIKDRGVSYVQVSQDLGVQD
jgi:transposase-like protein